MRALITGHRGFVGHHLIDLIGDEMDCFGFDGTDGHDIRDYEDVRHAVDLYEPDFIFHLAAQAYVAESLTDPRRCVEVNVMGTTNLLEACRQLGSKAKILLVGTSEEYGYAERLITEDVICSPTTPYGASKLAATQLGLTYARQFGLHVVVTRAFNHAGPGQPPNYAVSSFARQIARVEAGLDDVVTHGNLDAIRNYTDVRDVVRAYRAAIERPSGEIFNVCSENTVSMRHVLETLASIPVRFIELVESGELYRTATTKMFQPSHEKLTAATGWEPQIELYETLCDTLEWWRTKL